MNTLQQIGLVDLLVAGLVLAAVVGALRSRRGVLGAVGTVVGTLALVWLASVALWAWGPSDVSNAVQNSAFGETFPVPHHALAELHHGPDGPGR